MKIRGVEIFLITTTLVISTAVAEATTIDTIEYIDTKASIDEHDAELPIWKVGDKWIYNVEVEGRFGTEIDFNLSIKNFKFEVVEIQEDRYKINLTVPRGDITGSGSVDLELIKLEGELINTKMDGTLYVNKTHLSFIGCTAHIDGYIDKIIDIHVTADVTLGFYKAKDEELFPTNYTSLKFPMNIGDIWTVPLTFVVLEADVNLIPGGPHPMYCRIDEHQVECVCEETISVPAGVYDALKISRGPDSNFWYAVEAGNIVKVDYKNVDLGWGWMVEMLKMDLVSTSYYPPTNPPDKPITPTGPTTLEVGDSGSYTTRATDPDGDKIRYIFDWGDGTETRTGLYDSGETITESHIWTKKGTYQIRVKAKDKYGATSEWSDPLTVEILNNPPAKPNTPEGPTSGKIKTLYTYTTSTTDPDGHRVKYCFDWGDGTTTWTEFIDPGEIAEASHKWTKKGDYEIKVKAVDEYSEESEWSDPLPVNMPKYRNSITPLRPHLGTFHILQHLVAWPRLQLL
jgi:hypothetical protein